MRQGQKRGVKRFGVAHGLRLTPTMEYVIKQYAGQVGVSLSDAMRLLLEQATSQRVNAVEAQAERLARIESKLDDLAGSLAHVEGVVEAIQVVLDPPYETIDELLGLPGIAQVIVDLGDPATLDVVHVGEALSPEEQRIWDDYQDRVADEWDERQGAENDAGTL